MNIFFIASLYGRSGYESNYEHLIKRLQELGHTVNSTNPLKFSHEEIAAMSEAENIAFHKKIIDGIKQADAVFAEVSHGSTSVGYLMAVANQASKPVVAFYSGDAEPHLFRTLEETSDKFQVIRYKDVADLHKEVEYALDFVLTAQDTRFNFFISSELSSYLDWISKKKKIPRSVYLRELINQEMERAKGEFSS